MLIIHGSARNGGTDNPSAMLAIQCSPFYTTSLLLFWLNLPTAPTTAKSSWKNRFTGDTGNQHNPTIFCDPLTSVTSRLALHRDFNDLAADVNASALSRCLFVMPNMVNDGHDTTIDFAGEWVD
ncbi:hypothetical protein EDB85DRAFT_2290650 [Lactarius pseudohatsudake]|nr:hypothetical protein EDB85DRAFT_2290650 [Lactarius pseudohatsudake]